MNSKKAKALRRMARAASTGLPAVKYELIRRPDRPITRPDAASPVGYAIIGYAPRNTLRLKPRASTRAIYHELKRAYR